MATISAIAKNFVYTYLIGTEKTEVWSTTSLDGDVREPTLSGEAGTIWGMIGQVLIVVDLLLVLESIRSELDNKWKVGGFR